MSYFAVCLFYNKEYLRDVHSGSKPSRFAQEFKDNWNTKGSTRKLVLNVAFLAHADLVSLNFILYFN